MQSNPTMEKAVAVYSDLKTKADETKDTAKERALAIFWGLKTASLDRKDQTIALLRDPQFQTCTVATAGGAITLGTAGGAFGLASGVVVGSAAGVVPALFTFGLSIPVGGAIGGGTGLCAGTLIGGTSGGAAGLTAYKYRVQIKNGMMTIKVKSHTLLDHTKSTAIKAWKGAKTVVSDRTLKLQVSVNTIVGKATENSMIAAKAAKTKANDAYSFATTTKVGVTSSSAVAGAVVGGATTGAFGTVAGAALGIVPAFFTFGLSIPVGAAIGLCAGTAVGGTAGAAGGGAIGYTGFTHGKAIKDTVKSSFGTATAKAATLKTKTVTRAVEIKSMVMASTGGSDKAD